MQLSCLVLVLCATGISAVVVQAYNDSINPVLENQPEVGRQNEPIRRFACPIGFFRLKGYCYYLSAGMATWRDAHFLCKDRNATLAILDRNGKDRMLRKYLENDQFMKLERWIGGIFNWQKMAWEWGLTGEEMVFQNFGRPQTGQAKQQYAWHCVTIDPALNYKWTPRSCVERKYYVCQVRAGRLARRRKKTTDPYAPQNQRLKKPRKKGKKYSKEPQKPTKQTKPNKSRSSWRNWAEQNAYNDWVHGVNAGSRPPSNNRVTPPRNRMRHHANRSQQNRTAPRIAQTSPGIYEYGAYLRDRPIHSLQGLTGIKGLSDFQHKINDIASEEVIHKP